MAKYFFHIGLPKTASTSLQAYFFPALEEQSTTTYLGVHQPRTDSNSPFYEAIIRAIRCPSYQVDARISEARNHLSDGDGGFIISEETMVVDAGIVWQEKLGRIAKIFENYELTILVNLRSPVECAFSLYVELYHSLCRRFPSFQDFWQNSNQAKIFRYESFLTFVSKCFQDNDIKVFSFENIAEEGGIIAELCHAVGIPGFEFALPNVNLKQKCDEGVYTRQKTFADLINATLFGGHRYSVKGALRWASRSVGLNKLPYKIPGTSHFVPFPQSELLVQELEEDAKWLFEHHGIDYRQ